MFVELCSLRKIAASSLLCKVEVFFFESMTIENSVCYYCSLKMPVNALVNPTLLKIYSTEIIYQTSFLIETSFQGHDDAINSWIVIFSVIVANPFISPIEPPSNIRRGSWGSFLHSSSSWLKNQNAPICFEAKKKRCKLNIM